MSKLYEKYLQCKKENPSALYLFKNGIFFIFLDEDAKKMSRLLHLKLTNLNATVFKCGFPIGNLEKYSNMIRSAGYEIYIVNSQENQSYSSTEFILNSEVKSFIKKLSAINADTLSISEAYSFIETISQEANRFIKELKF